MKHYTLADFDLEHSLQLELDDIDGALHYAWWLDDEADWYTLEGEAKQLAIIETMERERDNLISYIAQMQRQCDGAQMVFTF